MGFAFKFFLYLTLFIAVTLGILFGPEGATPEENFRWGLSKIFLVSVVTLPLTIPGFFYRKKIAKAINANEEIVEFIFYLPMCAGLIGITPAVLIFVIGTIMSIFSNG